jgi:integrase
MSVHLRKDGRWCVDWVDRESKKHLRKYFGRGPEAEVVARDFNTGLGLHPWEHRTPQANSAYFIDLLNAYTQAKISVIQPVSMKNLLWKMSGVIVPEIGSLKASQITPQRIDAYVSKRLKKPIRFDSDKKPVGYPKRTTIHREISDIKAVLNWAVKRRLISFNPITAYEMPKRDDAVILPPSEDEIARILAVAPHHLRRSILISYYTGLRPGARELFSMVWQDVSFETGTILVRSARKGGIKTRLVPIHKRFLPELLTWKDQDANAGRKFLIHFRGKQVHSIKKSFGTAKRKAGISRRIRLYDLRHGFASMALRAGADLRSVSEIMGHSRPDTTSRIYQHTDSIMHQDVISRIPMVKEKSPTSL